MRDNEVQPIFQGRITEFGPETDAFGAPTACRVAPLTAPDAPTALFAISYTCRPPRCDIPVGALVWCARAEDGSGIVLATADGNDTSRMPAGVTFVRGGTSGEVAVEGTVRGAEDVVAGGVALKGHVHGYDRGDTTGPR